MWVLNLNWENIEDEVDPRRKPKVWKQVSRETLNFGNRAGHKMV